jgi:hypothetical protein
LSYNAGVNLVCKGTSCAVSFRYNFMLSPYDKIWGGGEAAP